jgi:tetratricopeptide (TPR) repeat protein
MTDVQAGHSAAIASCAEGALLTEAGDPLGAIACYQRAIEHAPSLLPLHIMLANAQQLHGDVLDARATLRRAIRVTERPDADADFTLGKALVEAGAGADAVPCFRRVRAEFPADPAAAAALAAALRDAQQADEAWTEIQSALRLAPHDAVALLTAALIRHDLGDFAGALSLVEESLTLRPTSATARVTRGYLRHLLGDATGGWNDFESRALPRPDTSAQLWAGESLAGKTLLLMGEQGVGDQFQFLRYAQHPRIQAADRVVIGCQAEAVALLRAAGFDAVARTSAVETEVYAPLLSLPRLLGVDASWSPAGGPYICLPDADRRDPRRVRRVGVVWAGNPAHRNDTARSLPPSLMHGLLHTHPAVQFVCLQHGVADDAMPLGSWERPVHGDWLATARTLQTLDLLISVDTGIAHLAGALGTPVWILLPHVPDWRWGTSGSTTPWYPTARLFRQPVRGDWSRVLTNVSAALSGAVL